MKKLFAIVAMLGVFSFGSTAMAQDEVASVEGQSIHKTLKRYFIEGSASFMSLVAIALVIGLAFCVERIIYLSLAEINTKKFIGKVEDALEKGDVEAAKDIARNTRGPIASIYYQGLMRIDQGLDTVEHLRVLRRRAQQRAHQGSRRRGRYAQRPRRRAAGPEL